MGALLERTYGARYEDLARRLFASACLRHVGFWGETDLSDPHVLAQPLHPPSPALRQRNYGMLASGGLLITARDLVSWQYALTSGRVLSSASLEEMFAPRGSTSIGQSAFGSFLVQSPLLGRTISARGTEDWGDNAYLNDYRDRGLIFAITTSRGPAEGAGRPLFRDSITPQIERVLAERFPNEGGG